MRGAVVRGKGIAWLGEARHGKGIAWLCSATASHSIAQLGAATPPEVFSLGGHLLQLAQSPFAKLIHIREVLVLHVLLDMTHTQIHCCIEYLKFLLHSFVQCFELDRY